MSWQSANMARKTVIAEVTAALDTFSDIAICGSDGKRMLVASVPVAASAARTVISAKVEETSGRGAAAIVETVSSAMAAPGEYDMMYIIQNGRGNLLWSVGGQLSASCPGLSRASTSLFFNEREDVDGRGNPGIYWTNLHYIITTLPTPLSLPSNLQLPPT